MELGHHEAARLGEMDLLPPVRHPRRVQPSRRRLDGRDAREQCAREEAHRRDVRAAGHGARPAHAARGPRVFDEVEARCPAARRPRRDEDALTAARLERRPVLRSAVQDSQVPARVPRALRLGARRAATAARSSTGTPAIITTSASGCSHLTTSTMASRRPRTQRAATLEAAYRAHLERFAHGLPAPPQLPSGIWINKPKVQIDTLSSTTPSALTAGAGEHPPSGGSAESAQGGDEPRGPGGQPPAKRSRAAPERRSPPRPCTTTKPVLRRCATCGQHATHRRSARRWTTRPRGPRRRGRRAYTTGQAAKRSCYRASVNSTMRRLKLVDNFR